MYYIYFYEFIIRFRHIHIVNGQNNNTTQSKKCLGKKSSKNRLNATVFI